MVQMQTLENYMSNFSPNIPLSEIVVALLLSALLSFILSRIYIKYGTSLSNRKKFGSTFVPLAMTTALIITVVKSSLALSLGLVGALSIVRFRTAIKEPEELVFLFFTISIGLGFGANQILVTTLSFILITIVLLLRHFSANKEENQNLSLTITSERNGKTGKVTLNNINFILKKHCSFVHLKRYDQSENSMEASFFVGFRSITKLNQAKNELEKLSRSINIVYLERA